MRRCAVLRRTAAVPLCLWAALAADLGATPPVRTLTPDDSWTAPPEIDPASPAGQLREVQKALLAGEYARAETLASAWLERNDPNPLRPQAYLARGDAKVGRGDEYQALYDYEAVATLYPGSDVFVTALERELDIAKRYAHGLRRKFLGLRFVDAGPEAEELLIRIQERLPGSQIAEEAGMELADYYFRRGEMDLAAEAYQLFIENYSRSPNVRKARLRLIYARLASFKGPEFDISGLLEARAQLQMLERLEPLTAQQIGAESLVLRIDESSAAKLLTQAEWYDRGGDVISAELTVRRLVERYPRTIAARRAVELGAQLVKRLPAAMRAKALDYQGLLEGAVEMPAPKAPVRIPRRIFEETPGEPAAPEAGGATEAEAPGEAPEGAGTPPSNGATPAPNAGGGRP